MAYQRVTLATLRSQLDDRLKTSGNFWSQAEKDQALNEAIAVWQAMTGEKVITISQSITDTAENLVQLVTTATQGQALSILRVTPSAGGASLREMSLEELDQGKYGWRTETATVTTQRPEYWCPIGVDQLVIYPRVGATATYSFQCYADSEPLDDSADYIDISEGELARVLAFAQALLSFKEGVVEGTDNAQALKELFLFIAQNRNRELTKMALYRNYMGHDEGMSEANRGVKSQQGVRG